MSEAPQEKPRPISPSTEHPPRANSEGNQHESAFIRAPQEQIYTTIAQNFDGIERFVLGQDSGAIRHSFLAGSNYRTEFKPLELDEEDAMREVLSSMFQIDMARENVWVQSQVTLFYDLRGYTFAVGNENTDAGLRTVRLEFSSHREPKIQAVSIEKSIRGVDVNGARKGILESLHGSRTTYINSKPSGLPRATKKFGYADSIKNDLIARCPDRANDNTLRRTHSINYMAFEPVYNSTIRHSFRAKIYVGYDFADAAGEVFIGQGRTMIDLETNGTFLKAGMLKNVTPPVLSNELEAYRSGLVELHDKSKQYPQTVSESLAAISLARAMYKRLPEEGASSRRA